MPDIIIEAPSTESVTPPVAPIPSDQPGGGDAGSLSDHVEAFHADKLPDEKPQETAATEGKKKHKSFRHLARAEDVPRIRELTKERDEWKSKYEAAQKAQPTTAPVATPSVPAAAASQPAASQPAAPQTDVKPLRAKPVEDDIAAGKYQSYADFAEDLADWKFEQREFNSQKAAADAQAQQSTQAEQTRIAGIVQKYRTGLQTYLQQYPDRSMAFQNLPDAPPLMFEALAGADNGPDLVYSLRTQHPDLYAEMHLLTDGKPVHPQNVASVTQWLHARLKAGTTGAATVASTPYTPASRPPTPVRTTPMPPAAEPPGDGSSLRDHATYFKKARW